MVIDDFTLAVLLAMGIVALILFLFAVRAMFPIPPDTKKRGAAE